MILIGRWRYDRRLVVALTDSEAARPLIEDALEAYTKRWRFDEIRNGDGEQLSAVYSVRLRKGVPVELLTNAVRVAAAPYAAEVSVE